ncbi:MAG TPA: hypothetical protein VKE70_25000 [Candidatus Solibacter sp.]|nr:hypothetical protein [Candidatus Solibacter sp.]
MTQVRGWALLRWPRFDVDIVLPTEKDQSADSILRLAERLLK